VIITLSIALYVFTSGCATTYLKGRHTTSTVDFENKNQQPYKKDTLLEFECDYPNRNVPTIQEINNALMELNPNRFSSSNDAVPIKVSATKSGEHKRRTIWNLPYLLTLGVLPGWQRCDYKYPVKIVFNDTSDDIFYLNGAVEYRNVEGLSLTPLGLIYGNNRKFSGDAEVKVRFIDTRVFHHTHPKKSKIRPVYINVIAKEINALIDKFEATQPVQSTVNAEIKPNTFIGDEIKIAIFDPTGNHEISSNLKSIVREEVSNAVVKIQGYTVLEREQIDKVIAENTFQSSGLVVDEQITDIGRKLGANKVCIITISKFNNSFHISCKLVDVITGRVDIQNTGKTNAGGSDIDKVVAEIVSKMLRK